MECEEILKAVFPFLDGYDLVKCMLVCKQWRNLGEDDYLWKCLCFKEWPSVFKRRQNRHSTFRQLYRKCTRPRRILRPLLPPPRLSFKDLEFYVDIRECGFSGQFSGNGEIGTAGRPGVCGPAKSYLVGPRFKMTWPIEPPVQAAVTSLHKVHIVVDIFLKRRDSNEVAQAAYECGMAYIDRTECRSLGWGQVFTSPRFAFVPGFRAWISLFYLDDFEFRSKVGGPGLVRGSAQDLEMDKEEEARVFGMELEYFTCGEKLESEEKVLWLFDMLDWVGRDTPMIHNRPWWKYGNS